jgi:alpha-N-arabinofuranosidase
MFASARIENVLEKYEKKLVLANEKFRRKKEPIRFCIDEWNNRHLLYSGTKFELSRKDLRKLYDVEAISSMLNVFIRQSPYIGMANYIFPVNGHGLVVTTNEDDAFKTPPYYVFKLYREYMVGSKCDIEVKGPGISSVLLSDLEVDGAVENNIVHKDLCYIDGSAVLSYNNSINIAITNRSYNKTEKVKITIPENYNIIKGYFIESKDIYDCNTSKNRYKITPRIMKNPKLEFSISPCGFYLLHCERIN